MNGKVEIITMNEGKDTQFFALFYAGSDVCIRAGWTTRAGAERYARKNAYEII